MQKCFILIFIVCFVYVLGLEAQVKTNLQNPLSKDSTLVEDSLNNFRSFLAEDSVDNSFKDSLKILQKKFENFEYGEVIKSANQLLISKEKIPRSDLFEILRMKGISHFSLSEDEEAKNSFIQILKGDTSYVLDSLKTSPKIVSFFDGVKNNYINQLAAKAPREVVKIDTVYITDPLKAHQIENDLKTSFLLSLIYPGVGHLYDGQKTKGWILTSLTTLSLASSIYFYIDANKKRNAYLDEKNPANFDSKYSTYNKAYKYRNYSFIAVGVIWLYSQLDLLFFSDSQSNNNISSEKSTIGINPMNGIKINFSLSF